MKVTLIVLTLLLLTPYTLLSTEKEKYLSYEELIKKIKTGSVESINLGGYSRITGICIEDGNKKLFRSWRAHDSANDSLLLELLKEQNVAINIVKEKRPSQWPMMGPGLVMFLVPIITLIYVVMINRKANKMIKGEKEPR